MKYKLSVVIPVYNSENYLAKCLESIIDQSFQNLEVILIDDGSTDKSPHICDMYSEKYRNIKTLHVKNSGPSAARNLGITLARGEYISFIDADDYIESDMMEKMIAAIEKFQGDIAICDYYIDTESTNKRAIISYDIPENKSLNFKDIGNYIVPQLLSNGSNGGMCNKIYKSELLLTLLQSGIKLNEKINYGEDHFYLMTLFKYVNSWVYVKKPLYHYIKRNNNSLTRKKRQLVERFEILNNFYKNRVSFAEHFNQNTVAIKIAYYKELLKCFLHSSRAVTYGNYKEMKAEYSKLLNTYTLEELKEELSSKSISKTYAILFYLVKKKYFCLLKLTSYIIAVFEKLQLKLN